MAGAATIRALVNRPRAEPEIRGSRARSGSRGSSQDYDGPGLVSDRLYRPRWLGWQLRAGETRPVSNASSLRGSTQGRRRKLLALDTGDRKSTRLNSSHTVISYAVFCLKKKKKTERQHTIKTEKESPASM